MQLPRDWTDYKDRVLAKVHVCCKSHLWAMQEQQVLRWLNNFEIETHEYLALRILDSIIFRTDHMLEMTYKRLLATVIRHDVCNYHEQRPIAIDEWFSLLSNTPKRGSLTSKLKLSPIISTGDGAENSSGAVIRRLNGGIVNEKYNLPHQNRDLQSLTDKVILLVDDFVGSGEQFNKYSDSVDLESLSKTNLIIYAPFIALKSGLNTIINKNSKVLIRPGEILDDSQSIFSGSVDDWFHDDRINKIENALNCYNEIKEHYGFYSSSWLGKNDSALSLVFEWGCPNQTLTLLYATNSKRDNWTPFYRRRSE